MSYQNYVLPDKQREKERVREAIAYHGFPVGCVVEYAAQYELDLEILKNLMAEGFGPIWHEDKTFKYLNGELVTDVARLEIELVRLQEIREEYSVKVRGLLRKKSLMDKDEQIAYIKDRIFSLQQQQQPPQPPQPQPSKRGRPRGKASGSLSPIVEKRKGKTYPVIAGERVPKDLAFDYPEQFNWLYQWAEWCDRRERWITRSKRVPSSKVHNIKYMIACRRTVSEILSTLNGSTTNHASPPFSPTHQIDPTSGLPTPQR